VSDIEPEKIQETTTYYISGKNVKLVMDKQIVQECKISKWPEGYDSSILNISLKHS
jgi:hypothetical protein